MSEVDHNPARVLFRDVSEERTEQPSWLRGETRRSVQPVRWGPRPSSFELHNVQRPASSPPPATEPSPVDPELALVAGAEVECARAEQLAQVPEVPEPETPEALLEAAAAFAKAAEALEAAREAHERATAEAKELALQVAKLLVGAELEETEGHRALLDDALTLVDEATKARVSPDVAARLGGAPCRIEVDESLAPMSCIVETPEQIVDASIDARIDAIRRALEETA